MILAVTPAEIRIHCLPNTVYVVTATLTHYVV
jgi:hypothetical protein